MILIMIAGIFSLTIVAVLLKWSRLIVKMASKTE